MTASGARLARHAAGLVSRESYWSAYTADAFFGYRCTEGAGTTLAEVNGAATSAAYSGTTTGLWADAVFGVRGAGDGGYQLPAAVNSVFRLRQECRVVVAAWAAIENATMTNSEALFSVGPDNTTQANAPGVGHFRLDLNAGAGSIVAQRLMYRNAGPDASPPNQQEVLPVVDMSAAVAGTEEYHHLAVVLHSDGADVDYVFYVDGAAIASNAFVTDGTGPLHLDDAVGQVSLLCRNTKANTPRVAQFAMGYATTSKLQAIMFWRKNNATATEATDLVDDFYRFRGEASARL